MRVLIVDDDDDFADVLAEEISVLGHEVVIARSGHEAIAAASRFSADIAFVDVILPDINGITLAAVLRGVTQNAALRVIGISGVERFTLDAASARGIFDARLAKPVSVADLERALAPAAIAPG
jgi:CheY-like chemotaxis protein